MGVHQSIQRESLSLVSVVSFLGLVFFVNSKGMFPMRVIPPRTTNGW